ncbi:hypothetical protein HNQ91_003776 [Filimonas zeae]|uniref:DUF2004 domain-containing protein n=1 Tax=Filimonas zeae TaxID=1737353 RepID=A0A917J0J6_9BACT|nr:DUF2004 domain-containing protein [Filimonas zeae]MDR6340711.1 hypothetical protein [Filimonas zeae]GGH74016.1 hypothetical protein GCM10011379_36170 [Filimonas zeae]
MRPFKLPIFNEINLDDLENWYDAQVEVDGATVSMDMNFDETSIGEAEVTFVKNFLEKLPEITQSLRAHVLLDYASGTVTKEFLSKALDSANEEKLNAVLASVSSTENTSRDQQLLAALRLKRIAFFPEDAERFAFFDYTIGTDFTDYLLAFTLNTQQAIVEVSVENY